MSVLEPTGGRERRGESRAWIVTMRLVGRQAPGLPDETLAEVPPMEFSVGWVSTISKRHRICAHPTDLSCQILRRAAEYLRSRGLLKGSGLEGIGGDAK